MQRLTHAALLVTSSLLIAACGTDAQNKQDAAEPPTYELSGPIYSSVADLVQAADVAFRGHITGVHSRELDDPDESRAGGPPVVIYNFAVSQSFGPDKLDAEVYLCSWDVTVAATDAASDLSDSGEMVVFAKSEVDLPGIDTVDVCYTPVMYDNGLLNVNGERAIPRSDKVQALRPGQPGRSFTVTEVEGLMKAKGQAAPGAGNG